ncbi:copper-binding protein [Pseudomonas putida]|uniref:copper-binding protein n=1 Tax=Pseudomonas putida TaxID=303 RepID=UPI0018D8ACFA|nr:copper-binding protein [Pseudomonas putida]MBH3389272.1 copper-binding protein [Pseudomonas putida]MCC9008490.1 copper-binding protein [Pseudomonas putida]
MKKLYLSVALFVAFASGAQAQDSMVGMNMDGMDMKEAPSAPAAHAEGTVKAIDALGGKVTLAHGPVPALKWPAMTMGFKASAQQLEQLKVGDKVAFDFRMEGSAATIVDIQKE